jgi:hypothetical protein
MAESKLRPIEAPFIAFGPSGVAIRTRLKDLTSEDDKVLRAVGAHLGMLAPAARSPLVKNLAARPPRWPPAQPPWRPVAAGSQVASGS